MSDWFVTAPGPRGLTSQNADAGQRGWRLHAVVVENENTTLGEIRLARAACGITPEYGWTLDLFIEKKCARCERALEKRNGIHPYPFQILTSKAGKFIRDQLVTADTISDEQLRELQRSIRKRGAGREIHIHILDALRANEDARYRGARYNARAFCAGVWNARAREASK